MQVCDLVAMLVSSEITNREEWSQKLGQVQQKSSTAVPIQISHSSPVSKQTSGLNHTVAHTHPDTTQMSEYFAKPYDHGIARPYKVFAITWLVHSNIIGPNTILCH